MAKGFLRHAPGGPEAINSESFDDDISDVSKTYVIEFWSAGCAACERIADALHASVATSSGVVVYTANVDEEPELAQRCKVFALPAVLLYREGNEVFRSHSPDAPRLVKAFINDGGDIR